MLGLGYIIVFDVTLVCARYVATHWKVSVTFCAFPSNYLIILNMRFRFIAILNLYHILVRVRRRQTFDVVCPYRYQLFFVTQSSILLRCLTMTNGKWQNCTIITHRFVNKSGTLRYLNAFNFSKEARVIACHGEMCANKHTRTHFFYNYRLSRRCTNQTH